MKLRVGCVSYLNALPYRLPISLGKVCTQVEWIYDIPTHLNALLRQGLLDVALTSSVEIFHHPYTPLPGIGIAASREVMSVNLYTQYSPVDLDHKIIAVTPQSATAFSLLKVLCKHLWHISPQFVSLDSTSPLPHYPAFLMIGNEGLKHQKIPGFQTIDLATAWFELSATPLIFALFAIRSGVSLTHVAALRQELLNALQWSYQHLSEIETTACAESGLDPELIRRYFSKLRYEFGREEMIGLEKFRTFEKE